MIVSGFGFLKSGYSKQPKKKKNRERYGKILGNYVLSLNQIIIYGSGFFEDRN